MSLAEVDLDIESAGCVEIFERRSADPGACAENA